MKISIKQAIKYKKMIKDYSYQDIVYAEINKEEGVYVQGKIINCFYFIGDIYYRLDLGNCQINVNEKQLMDSISNDCYVNKLLSECMQKSNVSDIYEPYLNKIY